MYWYLSFLRPPPVSVSTLAGSITITPQVANDLRTEERLEPTEIFYTWQRTHVTTDDPLISTHLTTFTPPESSYKTLLIPLPAQARPGEKWRIGLASTSPDPSAHSSSPALLDLTGDQPGVIGVWSESIEITSGVHLSGPIRGVGGSTRKKHPDIGATAGSSRKDKGKGKAKEDEGPKQSRIRREWSLPDGGDLRIIEQTSFDLDKKIWDSGLALSSWIWRNMDEGDQSPISPMKAKVLKILRREHLYMVELGSGTGLVSIALGKKFRTRTEGRYDIVTTDLRSAIALMEENLALNGCTAPDSAAEDSTVYVRTKVLDWEQPLPSWLPGNGDTEASWPDLVIAADVTYNTSSFPYLLKTLVGLLKPDGGDPSGAQPPLLLLAYKQRDPGERELWNLLREKGVGMTMVESLPGAEEDGPVEIWVGGVNVTS